MACVGLRPKSCSRLVVCSSCAARTRPSYGCQGASGAHHQPLLVRHGQADHEPDRQTGPTGVAHAATELQSNFLTVLPEGFVEATGNGADLVTRELPLTLDPVHVEMIWHLRQDTNPAHRWLRDQLLATAAAAT